MNDTSRHSNTILQNKSIIYTKYIIICSVILLALVIALYDFLKVQPEDLLITTQSDDVNDGSRQQSSDIPYKTD